MADTRRLKPMLGLFYALVQLLLSCALARLWVGVNDRGSTTRTFLRVPGGTSTLGW